MVAAVKWLLILYAISTGGGQPAEVELHRQLVLATTQAVCDAHGAAEAAKRAQIERRQVLHRCTPQPTQPEPPASGAQP